MHRHNKLYAICHAIIPDEVGPRQGVQKMRYIGYTSKLSNFKKSGKIRGISK